jgi:hypothetical protein
MDARPRALREWFTAPTPRGRLLVLKRLRIAVLLYVLLFMVGAQFFAARQMADWDDPIWVDVYTVAGDDDLVTRRFLDALRPDAFAPVEAFFASEAQRYGVALEQPFKIRIVGEHAAALPQLAPDAGHFGVLVWSLHMRWLATRLRWRAEAPRGDIVLFAVFHEPTAGTALDRSTALDKGLIAVANLFADAEARGTNQVVVAHELLHTLRATDKYSFVSNAPSYPDGYAEPDARPLLPQRKAELMAGRIPLDHERAEMPGNLEQVVIGAATAREIGWPSLQ